MPTEDRKQTLVDDSEVSSLCMDGWMMVPSFGSGNTMGRQSLGGRIYFGHVDFEVPVSHKREDVD